MANLTYIMPCFIIADLKISVSFYVELLPESAVHVGREFFCNFQNRNYLTP